MKRILTPLLCLLLAVTMPLSAISAASEISKKDFSVDYSNGGTFLPVKDGTAEGDLPDGTKIKAEGLPENATALRIISIGKSKPKTRAWLADAIGEAWNLQEAFYVICTDKTGAQVPHEGAKISVGIDGTEDKTLFALTQDGKASENPVTASKHEATFTSTGAPYYAFCTEAKNPSTNDREMIALTLLGAELAILSIVVLLAIRRRNECEEE